MGIDIDIAIREETSPIEYWGRRLKLKDARNKWRDIHTTWMEHRIQRVAQRMRRNLERDKGVLASEPIVTIIKTPSMVPLISIAFRACKPPEGWEGDPEVIRKRLTYTQSRTMHFARLDR